MWQLAQTPNETINNESTNIMIICNAIKTPHKKCQLNKA